MQIKVTNTRMHKLQLFVNANHPKPPEVLVAEAKLVLVECEPEECLLWQHYFTNIPQKISLHNYSKEGLVRGSGKYLKPILISETEKIEVGDWVLVNGGPKFGDKQWIEKVKEIRLDKNNPKFGSISYESESGSDGILPYKVLALPEHFSPQILSQIVSGELKEGDKVYLEVEEI